MCQAAKLKEYSERHRFWADQAVKQTTFSNNILLTISIAVLGYFFVNRGVVYKFIILDYALPINPPVALFVAGTLLITISIIFGLLVSFSRLYDFRLTRHILLTRKRAMEYGYILPDGVLPDESLWQIVIGFLRIIFKLGKYEILKADVMININEVFDCRKPPFPLHPSRELIKKFNYLRSRSDSFGKLTHQILIWQLFLFGVGFCLYAIAMIINKL